MRSDIFLFGFLNDERQVPITYFLAALQLALLIASVFVSLFTASELWFVLAFLGYFGLALQLLFFFRIVTEKLGGRIDDRFPPVGHALKLNQPSPLTQFGWLHATGGCLLSVIGSALIVWVA